jgi:hypothetical protein
MGLKCLRAETVDNLKYVTHCDMFVQREMLFSQRLLLNEPLTEAENK